MSWGGGRAERSGGPQRPLTQSPCPQGPIFHPGASQDAGSRSLGCLLRSAEETQDHTRAAWLELPPLAKQRAVLWPFLPADPERPTSFFCSMAWCMILASFFFSSSRTDGESDSSSMLGNFLPKTQAGGTVGSEHWGSPGLEPRGERHRGEGRGPPPSEPKEWCAEMERGLCWAASCGQGMPGWVGGVSRGLDGLVPE